jgi:hypothetical protein
LAIKENNMTITQKKRTLAKIKKEDPVSYVILLMKGEYEGSIQYAYKEWGDPINDMEGWSSYRESAVWSLENKGEGIPGDFSEEDIQKMVTQYQNMSEEYKEKMRVKPVETKVKKKK